MPLRSGTDYHPKMAIGNFNLEQVPQALSEKMDTMQTQLNHFHQSSREFTQRFDNLKNPRSEGSVDGENARGRNT